MAKSELKKVKLKLTSKCPVLVPEYYNPMQPDEIREFSPDIAEKLLNGVFEQVKEEEKEETITTTEEVEETPVVEEKPKKSKQIKKESKSKVKEDNNDDKRI